MKNHKATKMQHLWVGGLSGAVTVFGTVFFGSTFTHPSDHGLLTALFFAPVGFLAGGFFRLFLGTRENGNFNRLQ